LAVPERETQKIPSSGDVSGETRRGFFSEVDQYIVPGYEHVPPSVLGGEAVQNLYSTLHELGLRGVDVPEELQVVLEELGLESLESLFDEEALLRSRVYCDGGLGGADRGCEMELHDGTVVEWDFTLGGSRESKKVTDRAVHVKKIDPKSGEVHEVELSVGIKDYIGDTETTIERRIGGRVITSIQNVVHEGGSSLLRFVDAKQQVVEYAGVRTVEGERVSELRIIGGAEGNPFMNVPVSSTVQYSAEEDESGGYAHRRMLLDLQYEYDGEIYDYTGLALQERDSFNDESDTSYSVYSLEVPAQYPSESPAIYEIHYNWERNQFTYVDETGAKVDEYTDNEGKAVDVPNASMVGEALRAVMANLRQQGNQSY
jgi:hypothetical protein